MALNNDTLFTYLRRAPFGGRLTQGQVDGVNAVIGAFRIEPMEYTAYALATTFRETDGTMQPIKEYGSDKYLSKYDTGKLAKALGNTPAADGDGQKYAGRGYPQLTGLANYRKASKIVGVDLVKYPDRAMEPAISAEILHDGMTKGWFTGKKLSDYFGRLDAPDDPKGARRIINGTDKASLIAGYYEQFLGALKAAETSTPQPADVVPILAQPDDVKPAQSGSIWGMGAGVMTAGAGVVTQVDNPWSLAAIMIPLAIAACVGIWLVSSGRITINRSHAI